MAVNQSLFLPEHLLIFFPTTTSSKMRIIPVALLAIAAAATPASGGPLSYAACQTGQQILVCLHTRH